MISADRVLEVGVVGHVGGQRQHRRRRRCASAAARTVSARSLSVRASAATRQPALRETHGDGAADAAAGAGDQRDVVAQRRSTGVTRRDR